MTLKIFILFSLLLISIGCDQKFSGDAEAYRIVDLTETNVNSKEKAFDALKNSERFSGIIERYASNDFIEVTVREFEHRTARKILTPHEGPLDGDEIVYAIFRPYKKTIYVNKRPINEWAVVVVDSSGAIYELTFSR